MDIGMSNSCSAHQSTTFTKLEFILRGFFVRQTTCKRKSGTELYVKCTPTGTGALKAPEKYKEYETKQKEQLRTEVLTMLYFSASFSAFSFFLQ